MKNVTKYTEHLHAAVIYTAPFASLVLLGVVLTMTSPLESGPAVILVVFTLLYVFILSAFSAALHLVGAVVRMIRPGRPFSLRRGYYVLTIIALAPVLLVALNTLGQLDVLEIVLIFILVGLGCFYVVRRTAK